MLICEEDCSACGACMNVCPSKCIEYKFDIYGIKRANINVTKCIHCNMCGKVCPMLNNIKGNVSKNCYSAWSKDEKIRKNSASGGIATELYRFAIKNKMWICGVNMDNNYLCSYSITNSNYDQFANSKYTYSDMGYIYTIIKKKILKNEKVLFIGLPCQVAAMKQYIDLYKLNRDLLILVDLVCHGVTPQDYLKTHIENICKKKKKNATEVFFRDPSFNTYTYTFTLKNNGIPFYKKKVYRNDVYQIGYHKGIAYRENCYHCRFSNKQRQGDLTLSDFAGVGKYKKCDYDNKNVSCVLVNTKKGYNFYQSLLLENRIYSEIRPIEEEYDFESRLHTPTPIPKERNKFKKMYEKSSNFDYSMLYAAKGIVIKNELKYYLNINGINSFLSRLLPNSIKERIKVILRK